MALIKCEECGQEVSDKAAACPKCGAPVSAPSRAESESEVAARPAQPVVPPRKKVSVGRQIAGLATLALVLVVGYRACLSESQRDVVNGVSSAVGLPVTPWVDRAQTALRNQLAKDDQQALVAKSVVGALHPTGNTPRIETFETSAIGETLVARFVVGWKGGITGTPYKTVVTWKCTKSQNLGLELTSDDSFFPVGDSELKTLSDWFQTEMYPVVLSNAG